MALGDLTSAEAVRTAIAEFDELGREAFLAKYGFGHSLRYFLEEGGERYDSKAIAGVAYGYEHPDRPPLTNDLFSGGVPVQTKLKQLGFAVVVDGSSASPVLQSALSGLDEKRLETRRAAEQAARDLLDRSAGEMTESDFSQLFKLLNSDFYRGRSHLNRLSPAFMGQTAQNLLDDVARLNSWTARIWRGGEEDALEAVGELLADRKLVPGAGTSYPTILMYLRDPKKWPLWLPITDRGLRAVWTYDAPRKPVSGRLPDYEAFSASAREFMGEYEIAPELLDGVLAEAGRGNVAPTHAGQVWMFQANPRYYDIDRALRELPEIEWTVRQYRGRVEHGDGVYIWKSGAGGGVVARGRVASPVAESLPDPAEEAYYRDREGFSKSEPRVRIAIEQLVDPPIGRQAAQDDPILGGLSILAFANATVHEVKPEEDERLRQLIDGVTTPVQTEPFTIESIMRAATEPPRSLQLGDEIYASVFAALQSGKHVILTGPPGTAKTTLAEAVADAAALGGLCAGHVLTTATADWTTYETIGGLKPTDSGGLLFASGHFLEAIERNQWLVIDELNRSNFDRAFGQLFTVLSGQAVRLPYTRPGKSDPLTLVPEGVPAPAGSDELVIPKSWRVVATMNVFDKSLLFEMSFALMRRFAFIEVPSPELPVFEALVTSAADGDPQAVELTLRFLALRRHKDLGPALFMDMARYLTERSRTDGADQGQLAFEAFYSFLLPQFEGIDQVTGERVFSTLRPMVGSQRSERLRKTLNTVLGLEISAPADAAVLDEEIPLEPDEPDLYEG